MTDRAWLRRPAWGLMGLVATAGILAPQTPSMAQVSLSAGGGQKIICWTMVRGAGGMTRHVSPSVPNGPHVSTRFKYHAVKSGLQNPYIDCQEYTRLSEEYARSFQPGGSFRNLAGAMVPIVAATFLPAGWDTTPTPGEPGGPPAATATKATAQTPRRDLPDPDGAKRAADQAREAEVRYRLALLDDKLQDEIVERRSSLLGRLSAVKTSTGASPQKPAQCRTGPRRSGQQNSNWDASRETAQRTLEGLVKQNCGYKGHSLSGAKCESRQAPHPATGAMRTVWRCSASFQCDVGPQICGPADSGASKQ